MDIQAIQETIQKGSVFTFCGIIALIIEDKLDVSE
jgi:hypothetical protein